MPLKRKEWPGFTINPDEFYNMCMPLQCTEVGELMMALLEYCRTGEDPRFLSTPAIRIDYDRMKKQIMKEKQDYALTCYRRSHAGKKTWQQRRENEGSDAPESAAVPGSGPAGSSSAVKKRCYGFHCTVFLTDQELSQLQRKFISTWQNLIHDYDQWAWENRDDAPEGDLAALIEFATIHSGNNYLPPSLRHLYRG